MTVLLLNEAEGGRVVGRASAEHLPGARALDFGTGSSARFLVIATREDLTMLWEVTKVIGT